MKHTQQSLLSEIETADYLSMSRSFLRQGRMNGDREGRTPTPPYLRIGRAIRYELSELNTWLDQFRNNPTSNEPEKSLTKNTNQ